MTALSPISYLTLSELLSLCTSIFSSENQGDNSIGLRGFVSIKWDGVYIVFSTEPIYIKCLMIFSHFDVTTDNIPF